MAKPKDTRMIAVLADLHLGHPDAPGLSWALSALDRAHAAGARALVMLGDVIDRSEFTSATYDEVDAFFAAAHDRFAEVHFIAGNHDVHHELREPLHPTEPHVFTCRGLRVVTASVAADPDPRELSFPAADLGLLHSSVEGQFSRKVCLPITQAALEATGHPWVLGHVHVPHVLADAPFIGWVGMGQVLLVDPATRAVTQFTV